MVLLFQGWVSFPLSKVRQHCQTTPSTLVRVPEGSAQYIIYALVQCCHSCGSYSLSQNKCNFFRHKTIHSKKKMFNKHVPFPQLLIFAQIRNKHLELSLTVRFHDAISITKSDGLISATHTPSHIYGTILRVVLLYFNTSLSFIFILFFFSVRTLPYLYVLGLRVFTPRQRPCTHSFQTILSGFSRYIYIYIYIYILKSRN
jgi:hypothetical protein